MPFKADLGQENGFIYGSTDNDIAVENGLKFHVDWLRGQKTGFFVDQRENRSLLEKYAKGRSVLNMFCYTGGFSVYAMRGQAKLVHSVDSSAKAIELTNNNIELNFPGDSRHEDGDISEGEIVRVITASGDFIAVGHYQIGSIAVRVLSLEISKLIMNFGALDLKVHLKLVRASI